MNVTLDRPRIAIGIILMSIGALWLLRNFGILRGFDLWGILWGLFFIWLGATVVGPRGRGVGSARLTLGSVLLLLGAISLVDGVGLLSFSLGSLISSFWPLILVILGLALLREGNRQSGDHAISPDHIRHDSIFGDFKLTEPGWKLQHVYASTVIGDTKIDLSKAQIPEGETIIDLRAVISDIDLWVPTELPVALEVQWAGFVTINRYGQKHDLLLRGEKFIPPEFESALKRIRVRLNLVFGDFSLTRAG